MDLSGPNKSLLLDLMSAATLRARVLAGNLSNQNTPGYKRQEVRFEELVSRALARGRDVSKIQPRVVVDESAKARADGNTVSTEDEVSAMRQNRLMYELYANILTSQSRLMTSAINGDR